MTYSVQVTGRNATVMESDKGRYTSMLLAVKAVIRAAKDMDITTITVNGSCYNIMDEFTGGLLRDSQIILMITGIIEPDPGLLTRAKNELSVMISSWLAGRAYRVNNPLPKAGYRRNETLDATLYGPFDARLEPLSYRSRQRRLHK
ncbi:hypothetical protein IBG34_23330 (plasmid) [Aeromonas media]|uniref:Uncharacterized protein n=1 Tax=Aeromonas caviae TaxID=648 RepID=A0A7D5UKS5_AERCA|nr:hypothetical protein [Aeromonas caviae]QLI60487.1 hypothetical protein C1C91_23695 [Aeromonas caviae]QYK83530.1 hypothetical protein IBG34_23330 [Aeromonas media]